MAIPVLSLSPEQLDQYRRTAARREKLRVAKIKPRRNRAWKLTRKAAQVLLGDGEGIHWSDLDEDISVEHLILGKPSGESQRSFKRWLEARAGSK